MLRRTLLQGLPLAAASLPLATRLALAQDAAAGYPDKPVTIIVPFAAGGNTDAFARMVAAGAGHGPGPALHRREQGRCRRQYRRGPARPLRARRLHAGHGHGQHPRDQPHALQEPALRSGHGVRADLAVRDAAQRAGRQSEDRGEDGPGADRAGQGQARHLHLRLVGRRHLDPSRGRDADGQDRHQDEPRALQEQRAGDDGRGRGPRRHGLRQHPDRGAAGERRQCARAGGHQPGAGAADARRSAHGRLPARASRRPRGTACSRPPARRPRSSTRSAPRCSGS